MKKKKKGQIFKQERSRTFKDERYDVYRENRNIQRTPDVRLVACCISKAVG